MLVWLVETCIEITMPQMLQRSAPHKVETDLYDSVAMALLLLRNDTFLLELLAAFLERTKPKTPLCCR